MSQAAIDELVETFELLGDWEERYRYLIELGRSLPPLAEAEKTDEFLVRGCVSRVWLHSRLDAAGGVQKLQLRADSDAHIVKGLVALLLQVYSGLPPSEVLAIDALGFLGRLGLDQHLSPSRSNGLHAMIQQIRARAAQALAA